MIKAIVHVYVFNRLKKKFNSFENLNNHKNIIKIFHQVCQEMKLKRKPELFTYREKKPLIFSIGLFRPAIFISPHLIGNLSNDETKTVLVHELQHIKRKDSLWIWLFDIFIVFIPLITILLFGYFIIFKIITPALFLLLSVLLVILFQKFIKKHFLFLKELRCDDRTIVIIKDPLLLASALIKVWRTGNRLQKENWILSLSQINSLISVNHRVELRIRRLADYRIFSKRTLLKKIAFILTIPGFVLATIFIWKFIGFYKNSYIEKPEGRIILKKMNTEGDEQMKSDQKRKKIIRRRIIKKSGGK
jgi:Zn-dependent protease with chaperone function